MKRLEVKVSGFNSLQLIEDKGWGFYEPKGGKIKVKQPLIRILNLKNTKICYKT